MQFGELTGTALDIELNSDDSTTLFTTARRQTAVNQGLQEFADLTECYVRRAAITVSCNTAEYSLSTIADYSRLSASGLPEYQTTDSNGTLTILAGDQFPRRDELWLNRYRSGWRQSTTPAVPTSYYLRPESGQTYLGLSDRPDVGSSEAVVLNVPYVARPQTLSASTAVPFTDTNGITRQDLVAYHQGLVHYAAFKLLPLIGDTDGAKGQFALFMDYVKRYLQNQRPKGGSHVTFQRNYFGDAEHPRGWDGDRVETV